MIREVGPEERAELEALLVRQIDFALFPLSNLRDHGLRRGDFPSAHDHASRFWRIGDGSVIALTQAGMLMPVLNDRPDLAAMRPVLAGQKVEGAVGPSEAVRKLFAALGLADRTVRKDSDEPAFALALSELVVPIRADLRLVVPAAEHRPLLLDWRAAYHLEILGTPEGEARSPAERDVDGFLARGSHRILVHEDRPVALTGFNAALPEIVQIGGVYTPPTLRGRGYARQAVALHLAEARARGVTRAVLFAASEAAARAYRAIGFQPNGSMAIVLLASAATVTV